jgi:4-amino-4-deoxy-L-arabinose transferase-like glycosyltransferase
VETHRGRSVLFGAAPVVAFAALVALFLWPILFGSSSQRYALDFEGACWITTVGQTPHGYFAKEIVVSDEVSRAWLTVAASDSVEVYLNGSRMAFDTFVSLNGSAIHDLTRGIRPGRNVLGLHVKRRSFPGPPRVLAKLSYTDSSGCLFTVPTDSTWSSSSVEEAQARGSIPWHSASFDHSGWNRVVVEGPPSKFEIFGSPVSPHLLAEPIRASWMGCPDPSVSAASFSRFLLLTSRATEAQIGVASTGTFDVAVNDILVARNPGGDRTLHVYDVSALLRPGANSIRIGVAASEPNPALLVQGYVEEQGGSVHRFQSDPSWRVLPAGLDAGSPSNRPGDERALTLGVYPSQPWGVLATESDEILLPLRAQLSRWVRLALLFVFVALDLLCVWLGVGLLLSKITGRSLSKALLLDGALHVPALVWMGCAHLLRFDVRFDPDRILQPAVLVASLALLFLVRALVVLPSLLPPVRGASSRPERQRRAGLGGAVPWILLVLLMAAGLVLRLDGLDTMSLSHDEISMVQNTQGLLQSGVPFKEIGPIRKPLTTYEVVPYSISVPVLLFGLSDFSCRLHSVFWGTVQIGLLFLLGRALFNRATGLLAAALQAFHPWCILWSQNAFYPQMTQALTTLTLLLFFKAVEPPSLRPKYLYGSAAAFGLTYLSWEGSGFLLVPLALALASFKGSDFSWMRSKHLWGSFGAVCLVVLLQMARRTFYQAPYLALGGRISEIGLPSLFFLDPMYDPYVYLRLFFFMENNCVPTLVLLAGTPFTAGSKPLRFLYVFLATHMFVMTNFLSVASNRYVYPVEPFLLLIAAAVCLHYGERLKALFSETSGDLRMAAGLCSLSLSLLLFLASNTTVLKLYLLSMSPFSPPTLVRQNVYWIDYRSACTYVKSLYREGDVVFSAMPHATLYYAGIRGYGLMTLPGKTMIYRTEGPTPLFMDKYVGDPLLTSFAEFRNLTALARRVWILAAPSSSVAGLNDEETLRYISEHFRTVFEGYNTRVYLWDKGG